MLAPTQGYIGGVLIDNHDAMVFGHAGMYDDIRDNDPIQEAMGDKFYPAMMFAKALRAEAYKNRPESAADLSIGEYLAKLGLSLGSMVSADGDVIGSTGFMPGPNLSLEWSQEDTRIAEHIANEPVAAYQLSGFCDQAALDPTVLQNPTAFAKSILDLRRGSLN